MVDFHAFQLLVQQPSQFTGKKFRLHDVTWCSGKPVDFRLKHLGSNSDSASIYFYINWRIMKLIIWALVCHLLNMFVSWFIVLLWGRLTFAGLPRVPCVVNWTERTRTFIPWLFIKCSIHYIMVPFLVKGWNKDIVIPLFTALNVLSILSS
jgi:hypothetical protein